MGFRRNDANHKRSAFCHSGESPDAEGARAGAEDQP
jgi:hypothetical protein